jgi:hypothetical protein
LQATRQDKSGAGRGGAGGWSGNSTCPPRSHLTGGWASTTLRHKRHASMELWVQCEAGWGWGGGPHGALLLQGGHQQGRCCFINFEGGPQLGKVVSQPQRRPQELQTRIGTEAIPTGRGLSAGCNSPDRSTLRLSLHNPLPIQTKQHSIQGCARCVGAHAAPAPGSGCPCWQQGLPAGGPSGPRRSRAGWFGGPCPPVERQHAQGEPKTTTPTRGGTRGGGGGGREGGKGKSKCSPKTYQQGKSLSGAPSQHGPDKFGGPGPRQAWRSASEREAGEEAPAATNTLMCASYGHTLYLLQLICHGAEVDFRKLGQLLGVVQKLFCDSFAQPGPTPWWQHTGTQQVAHNLRACPKHLAHFAPYAQPQAVPP